MKFTTDLVKATWLLTDLIVTIVGLAIVWYKTENPAVFATVVILVLWNYLDGYVRRGWRN